MNVSHVRKTHDSILLQSPLLLRAPHILSFPVCQLADGARHGAEVLRHLSDNLGGGGYTA